ncbi:MAG: helix-turn-helix domain-containing protein [Bacillota bacterium]|nr:helix-turn-helix domain-containing protein [Bacillota bacterium]
MKKYYTIREAAPILKLSEKEIYQLLSKGELKGFKRGHRWLLPRREIQNYLRNDFKCETLENRV